MNNNLTKKERFSDGDIRRMLRRKRRKLADAGVFFMRALVQESPVMKPRRIEISLGTYSLKEACIAARSVIAFIQAWGFRLTHKHEKQGEFDAFLPPRKHVAKTEIQS